MADWVPNLIMPGVAKCGTTTLHDLLIQHPAITGGIEKEVRFLMDLHDPLVARRNLHRDGPAAYREEYADKGRGDYRIWLDASPQYQYQDTARDFIAALDDKPLVLFIFRKPSDRLYSLYQYARYHQKAVNAIDSFAEFVDQIRDGKGARIAGRRMLENAWADTCYDRTMDQWGAIVPAGRLRAIDMEQLNRDMVGTLCDLAAWMDIDPAPFRSVHRLAANETVATRSALVTKMGKALAKVVPENALSRAAKNVIKGMNSGKVDKSEKQRNAPLLAELDAEFLPSVRRLHAMTGISFGLAV